jgi:hypothetical protein
LAFGRRLGVGGCPPDSHAEGHPLDSYKSIAVPVTRKRAVGKAKRAGHPAPPADSRVGGDVGPGRRVAAPVSSQPQHKYRIGQRLMVKDARLWARPQTACKVLALLPYEGSGALRYRVRSEVESFERVIDEADLFIPA